MFKVGNNYVSPVLSKYENSVTKMKTEIQQLQSLVTIVIKMIRADFPDTTSVCSKDSMNLGEFKRKAKIDMYYWTYNRYEKQLKKFENKESDDPELLDEIYKLQDRLHNNYLKKIE